MITHNLNLNVRADIASHSPLPRLTNEFGKIKAGGMDLNTTGYAVQRSEIPPLEYKFSMMRLGLNPLDRLYHSSIYGDIDTDELN